MKYINLFCIVSLLIASCSSNNSKSVNKDSVTSIDTAQIAKSATPPAVSSLCFLRTEGKSNQDSTSIELVIENNKVTGRMNWMPNQKDNRKGTIEGTISGCNI